LIERLFNYLQSPITFCKANIQIIQKATAVLIAGFTDQLGSNAINWDLSLRRAEAAKDRLQRATQRQASIFTTWSCGKGLKQDLAGMDQTDSRKVEVW